MKPHQTRARKPRIHFVTHKYVRKRAPEIEAAIRKAFKGADFIGGKTVKDVIKTSVRTECSDTKHLVAVDHNGKVVGALFHVAFKRKPRVRSTDVGWIFTSPSLPKDVRRDLGNRLIDKMQTTLRSLGYKRIVSTIGTERGKRFLKEVHDLRILRKSSEGLLWEKKALTHILTATPFSARYFLTSIIGYWL